jgi:hypothetical protein
MRVLVLLALASVAAFGQASWVVSSSPTLTPPYPNGWSAIKFDPVSGCMLVNESDNSNSIYSNTLYAICLQSGTKIAIATTGTTTQTPCPADTPTQPGDRHPMNQAIDTKRNRLWLMGGVGCNVTYNDTYYMTLNANPASNSWTKVTVSNYPTESRNSAMIYDPDTDALFAFGYDGGAGSTNNWIYCISDSGTLTARQTAAGCSAANNWYNVSPAGGTQPTAGYAWPGMVYDSRNRKVIMFGGVDAGLSTEANETWAYDVPTKTWVMMNSGASGSPPVISTPAVVHGQAAMAFEPATGLVHLHHQVTPTDWTYNYATNTWTSLGNLGGQIYTETIEYDANLRRLVSFGRPNNGNYTGEINTRQLSDASRVGGTVTITNKSGAAVYEHPLQLARTFVEGEVANYPQIGQCYSSTCTAITWLPTQADVKTRWPDGSVKHAIISVILHSLVNDQATYFTFQNQATTLSTALTKTEMLDSSFDFDAEIAATFSGPTTVTTSARTMLNATTSIPDCEAIDWSAVSGVTACYWLKGPINTTVILADHSTAETYDFGSDANESLRPMFHASFWDHNKSVRIRYIVEGANAEAIQDQTYSLVLTKGDASPSSVYTKSSFTHYGASRWTKTYWLGTTPTEAVNIDYSLAYLISTKVVPNFDTSKVVSGTKVTSEYSAWASASKDIFDNGFWTKAMGTPGGREDIAPMPAWHTRWIFNSDYRLREIALGMSDLASGFPAIIRENVSTKVMASGVNGLGRPASIYGRPTTSYASGYSYGYTDTVDQIKVVGAMATGGWSVDPPHLPDPWTISYQLTGDYYYLESGQFWAYWAAHHTNGALSVITSGLDPGGRGPTGKEGITNLLQMRGIAWTLRTWAETQRITPDAMPEKSVLDGWMADSIASEEGARNITSSPYNGNTMWNWGRNIRSTHFMETKSGAYPPLGQWRRGDPTFRQGDYGVDESVVEDGISLFEQSFLTYALGRSGELGYPTSRLLTFVAPSYVGMLTDAGFNRYMLQGRLPTVVQSGSAYITTWAQMKSAFYINQATCTATGLAQLPTPEDWCTSPGYAVQNATSYPLSSADGGYEFFGMAATSYLYGETGGSAAWASIATTGGVLAASVLNDNPSWAIIPRDYTPATSNGGSRISGRWSGRVQ